MPDNTWDDPVPDKKGRRRYDYFMLSDKEMDSRPHKHTWNRSSYPKCSARSKNRFVSAFGSVSKTMPAAGSSMAKQYRKKRPTFVLVVPKAVYSEYFLYGSLYNMCAKLGKKYKKGSYSRADYGKHYILYITLKF